MRESPYEAEDVLQALIASLLAGDQYSGGSPRSWLLIGRQAALPDDEDAGGRWTICSSIRTPSRRWSWSKAAQTPASAGRWWERCFAMSAITDETTPMARTGHGDPSYRASGCQKARPFGGRSDWLPALHGALHLRIPERRALGAATAGHRLEAC